MCNVRCLFPSFEAKRVRMSTKIRWEESSWWIHYMASKIWRSSIKVEASKTNGWKHETGTAYAHFNRNNPEPMMSCPEHLLKQWINMQIACHETNFKARDFSVIHKRRNPFRSDHLNDWLQNAKAIVAKNMDMKLDSTNYTTHTLKQGVCTGVARHGVPCSDAVRWQKVCHEKTRGKCTLMRIWEK